MAVSHNFSTPIFTDRLLSSALNKQIMKEVHDLMDLDVAGHAWSKKNYKNGFTSYASANEMQKVSPTFQKLEKWIDGCVMRFARSLDYDLGDAKLVMTTCWVNVMDTNSYHGLHLHPLSVISGTYYVNVPAGAPAIKFEDPRIGLTMHSPPRKSTVRPENRQFVEVPAKPGSVVLFESWLKHEVPLHTGRSPRVSVSFNYDWR